MNKITTLKELVLIDFKKFGERTAISSNSNKVSYSNLLNGALEISCTLNKNNNVNKKEALVALYTTKKLDLCYSLYGVTLNESTLMIISEDIPPEQVIFLLNKYCPVAIILDGTTKQRFKGKSFKDEISIYLIDSKNTLVFENISNESSAVKDILCQKEFSPDSNCVVLLTSGTTGQKKAVPISHKNFIDTSKMINCFMGLEIPISEMVTVPLSHAFGLRRVICNHLLGGTVVIEDGVINPARILKILRDFPCTGLSIVPTVFRLIEKAFGKDLKKIATNIKYIELGSSPLSKKEKEYLYEIFHNAQLCMHYGLTEASKASFLNFKDKEKLHTVGKPSPGVLIKIVGNKGEEVAVSKEGEICVKGFNVAREYLMDPEHTQISFKDGWFKTGDIGRFDKEGYLELLGRMDSMINVGGKKMHPLEIENYLEDHYSNYDLAIGDVSHEYFSGRPILCYSKTTSLAEDTFRSIQLDLRYRFEEFKVPYTKLELPQIPRTMNGKIMRKELKRMVKEKEL